MPYIQFDLPGEYRAETKRALAEDVGALFAEIMQTKSAGVNIAFRELGASNVHRWRSGALSPVVVVLCEVRRGRPAEQRRRLAEAIIGVAAGRLDWPADDFVVEFTQHAGDEMYRDGAFAPEWSAEEESPAG